MSDKTYWINKAVRRQLNKADVLRIDCGSVGGGMTAILTVSVMMIIFGLFEYFLSKQEWGLYLLIGATVVSAALGTWYFIRSSSACTEYVFTYDDKEMHLQYIGKKHIFFRCENTILEYKNGKAAAVRALYRPECAIDKVLEPVYDRKIEKSDSYLYVAKHTDVLGKKRTYKIKTDRNNQLATYSVGSITMTPTAIKKGSQKLAMPIPLYNAIKAQGVALPGDDVLQLVYNY